MSVSLGHSVRKEILNRAGSFDPVCPEHINTQPAIIIFAVLHIQHSFWALFKCVPLSMPKTEASTLCFLSHCIIDTVARAEVVF